MGKQSGRLLESLGGPGEPHFRGEEWRNGAEQAAKRVARHGYEHVPCTAHGLAQLWLKGQRLREGSCSEIPVVAPIPRHRREACAIASPQPSGPPAAGELNGQCSSPRARTQHRDRRAVARLGAERLVLTIGCRWTHVG